MPCVNIAHSARAKHTDLHHDPSRIPTGLLTVSLPWQKRLYPHHTMDMRNGFALTGLALMAVWGCGGSEVELASYDARTINLGSSTTLGKMTKSGSSTYFIGVVDGQPFVRRESPDSTTLLGNSLSGSVDEVRGLNDSGQIVGFDTSTTAGQGGLVGNQTAWSVSTFGLTLGTDYLQPGAISNNGSIGIIRVTQANVFSVIRRAGSVNTTLTLPTDFSPRRVNDINDSGKIVGEGRLGTTSTASRAFMSNGNNVVDLGEGTALAVNEAGFVVGQNQLSQPFRTTGPTSVTRAGLALLPGFTVGAATDVNDGNVVVGWQSETPLSPRVPVAWYENGALLDLRQRYRNILPAGVVLREAISISNDGTIAIRAVDVGTSTNLIVVFDPVAN